MHIWSWSCTTCVATDKQAPVKKHSESAYIPSVQVWLNFKKEKHSSIYWDFWVSNNLREKLCFQFHCLVEFHQLVATMKLTVIAQNRIEEMAAKPIVLLQLVPWQRIGCVARSCRQIFAQCCQNACLFNCCHEIVTPPAKTRPFSAFRTRSKK